MATGKQPAGAWMTPDDRILLVAITGESHVEAIDWRAQKLVKKIPTGMGAHNFLLLGDGKQLWVTSRSARQVTVVDMATRKVAYQIPVGRSPHGIYFQSPAPRR